MHNSSCYSIGLLFSIFYYVLIQFFHKVLSSRLFNWCLGTRRYIRFLIEFIIDCSCFGLFPKTKWFRLFVTFRIVGTIFIRNTVTFFGWKIGTQRRQLKTHLSCIFMSRDIGILCSICKIVFWIIVDFKFCFLLSGIGWLWCFW